MANNLKELSENSYVYKIEEEIEALKNSRQNEIELNDLVRIANKLGAQQIKSRGGSQVRFQCDLLKKYGNFTGGMFGIHTIHGGKSKKRVRKRDFVMYFYPVIRIIIDEIKLGDK